MSTAILKYFSPATLFTSRNDIGFLKFANRKANRSVKHVLEKQANQQSAKRAQNVRKLFQHQQTQDRLTRLVQFIH